MEENATDYKALYEAQVSETEKFKRYWLEANQELNAVKAKVKALATLLASVFPEKD